MLVIRHCPQTHRWYSTSPSLTRCAEVAVHRCRWLPSRSGTVMTSWFGKAIVQFNPYFEVSEQSSTSSAGPPAVMSLPKAVRGSLFPLYAAV